MSLLQSHCLGAFLALVDHFQSIYIFDFVIKLDEHTIGIIFHENKLILRKLWKSLKERAGSPVVEEIEEPAHVFGNRNKFKISHLKDSRRKQK